MTEKITKYKYKNPAAAKKFLDDMAKAMLDNLNKKVTNKIKK